MKNFKHVILAMVLMFVFTTCNTFAGEDEIRYEPPTPTTNNNVSTEADVYNSNLFEASDRPFVNQGNVPMAGMPGYFGDNNRPGHQFIPLVKLMMYNTAWEIKDSYPMDTKLNLNLTIHKPKVAAADRSKVVICTRKKFDQKKFNVTLIAIGTVNATNKDKTSGDVLDKILYEASLYGATHIHFWGEGTNTELTSSGWGIGFAYTKATDSSVSTGGTGFSTGWAGYNNLPWQQFAFLKVVDPNAVAEIEIEEEKIAVVAAAPIVDTQVDKAVKDHVAKQTGNHTNN